MKTITLLLAITVFSLSAVAQNNVITSPVYTKAKAMPQSGLVCVAPSVQPEDKDCFKMVDNRMRAVKDNIPFYMDGYRWLKNESVINDNGRITTREGQVVYLQNGESINGLGVITSNRCSTIAGESAVLNTIYTNK